MVYMSVTIAKTFPVMVTQVKLVPFAHLIICIFSADVDITDIFSCVRQAFH